MSGHSKQSLEPARKAALWRPIAGILLASFVLGLVYNRAAPLGLRSRNGTAAAATNASTTPVKVPAKGYFSETVAISLEPIVAGSPLNRALSGNTSLASSPSSQPRNEAAIPTIPWAEVKTLAQASKIVLVDARAAPYYQAEHIPGAVSLPGNMPAAELAAFTQKYPRSSAVVVYCATDECPLARSLASVLRDRYGYSNVKVMAGGFAEYRVAEQGHSQGPGK